MSEQQQHKRRTLSAEELASIPPAVAPEPARPQAAADLGAPQPGEDLEFIVARAERMKHLLQEEENAASWEAAERKAATYSHLLQQQEVADRIRRTQKDAPQRTEEGDRVPGEKAPRGAPRMVVPRAVMWDPTTIRDPHTGASLVPAGHVGRWVRVDEVTPMGTVRRTSARLHNFLAWGAEVVRDSAGKIVQSIYGVAVHAPPEVFAARSAKAAPTGTLNRKDLLAGVEGVISEFNRKVGEPAAALKTEQDHGAEKKSDGVDTYAARSR